MLHMVIDEQDVNERKLFTTESRYRRADSDEK